MSNVWNCSLCDWFAATTLKAVVRHIGAVHAHEAGFRVCCGIGGCPRTYTNFASYRRHLYRNHRDVLDITAAPSASAGDSSGEASFDDFSREDESRANSPDYFSCCFPLTLKHVWLFLLKSKEIYKVAESHLGSLVEDVSHMIELTVNHLEQRVCQQLNTMGVEMNNELVGIFRSPQLRSVCERLKIKSQQQKFVDENLELVVSL